MLEPALVQMGMPKNTAALLIEMWKGANAGLIVPQEQRSAKNTTPTTLESFVDGSFRAGVFKHGGKGIAPAPYNESVAALPY